MAIGSIAHKQRTNQNSTKTTFIKCDVCSNSFFFESNCQEVFISLDSAIQPLYASLLPKFNTILLLFACFVFHTWYMPLFFTCACFVCERARTHTFLTTEIATIIHIIYNVNHPPNIRNRHSRFTISKVRCRWVKSLDIANKSGRERTRFRDALVKEITFI